MGACQHQLQGLGLQSRVDGAARMHAMRHAATISACGRGDCASAAAHRQVGLLCLHPQLCVHHAVAVGVDGRGGGCRRRKALCRRLPNGAAAEAMCVGRQLACCRRHDLEGRRRHPWLCMPHMNQRRLEPPADGRRTLLLCTDAHRHKRYNRSHLISERYQSEER